jgi:hypothetical protein
MINDLTLLSGNEIPFIELGVSIHNPTIKEIAYVGEENFFIGRDLLNFSKDELEEQDKVNLKDKTDFDILIAILREHNAVMKKNRDCVLMVLALLFPTLQINFEEQAIVLTNESEYADKFISYFIDIALILLPVKLATNSTSTVLTF